MTIPRNTMAVIRNTSQGSAAKVVCVCSAGVLRSPTAAWILGNAPFHFNTRSCGTENYALIPLTEELLTWADVVICMESKHSSKVHALCQEMINDRGCINYPRVYTLNVSDDFDYKDVELVRRLTDRLQEVFPNLVSN